MLTSPRDAAYELPRRFACRVFGVHSRAVCAGRRDKAHEVWRLELHAGVARRDPWWDRVHPGWTVRDLWLRLRDESPMPARLDLAVSAYRDRRQWRRNVNAEWKRIPLEGYGICEVCQARQCSGRDVKHAACSQGLGRAVDAYIETERELAVRRGA